MFALCALTLCIPLQLKAQEKPEPPRRTTAIESEQPDTLGGDAVPKITLPEFEIAGEEMIRLGNVSKPAADDSWTLRSSTLERSSGDRGSPLTSLGTAEMAGLSSGLAGFTGRTFAGMGSFQTPEFDLWLGISSPSTGLLLRSGYTSSAGHVDHADYRDGLASLSGTHHVGEESFLPGNATLGGKVGFSGRAYRLYGSSSPEVQRTVSRIQGAASVEGELGDFSYDAGLFLNHASLSDASESSENEIGIRAGAEKRMDRILIKGSVDLWRDNYSSPSISQNPHLAGFLLDARYDLASRIQVSGGLGLYSVQGSTGDADFRLFPVAGVFWQTNDRISLSARFAPFLQRSSLSWLLQQNPYLVNDVHVRHPDYHTNFEVAADVDASASVSGRVAFTYQRADNLPVFIERTNGSSARPDGRWGTWDIDYSGTTRIFGLDAEVSANLTPESFALISFAWRNAENSTTGESIPYSPKVQVGAAYRHSFDFGVVLQTDLNIYGSQFAEMGETGSLKGYTLWDIKGEYEVLPLFVLGFGVQNILDQSYERWRGYLGVPRTAMLFGRYSW